MGHSGTSVEMGGHGKKVEEKDGSQTGESTPRKEGTPGPRGGGNRGEGTGESREVPSREGEARIPRPSHGTTPGGEGRILGLHQIGGESRPKVRGPSASESEKRGLDLEPTSGRRGEKERETGYGRKTVASKTGKGRGGSQGEKREEAPGGNHEPTNRSTGNQSGEGERGSPSTQEAKGGQPKERGEKALGPSSPRGVG